MEKIEKVKAALAEEVRWYRQTQHYQFALEGENLEAYKRAARRKMKAARAKFRRLIK